MSGRFAAMVPAGGLSSRMGDFKPLLPLGETTVLGRVVRTLRLAGVEHILVVAGHRTPDILEEAARLNVRATVNEAFRQGMFSSVTTGLSALSADFDAVFVLPADIPLVKPETVRALMAEHAGQAVIFPVFRGERGHPPLIARERLGDILKWDGRDGLRGALDNIEAAHGASDLPVADENILFDLDTPADYQEALRRIRRAGRPSPGETAALLDMHGVGARGLAHARAVAAIAVAVAKALNENVSQSGQPLDTGLVESAALLHDLAKGMPGHEAAGGRLLDQAGFPEAARIVEAHKDILLPPGAPLTEREVVYLADKLVSCDRPVSIRRRFQEKLDRFGHDPEAFQAISGRRDRALGMLARVEALAGRPIESILAGLGSQA